MSRPPSPARPGRRRAIALIAAGVLAPCAPFAVARASGDKVQRPGRTRLSANRFFTLDPFTLPLFQDKVVTEQFTLVIAIELRDEGQRIAVSRMLPRLRDAMYTELYRMVTFRRTGMPLPRVDDFKRRLYETARRVAGDEIVAGLLVQQAYRRRAR